MKVILADDEALALTLLERVIDWKLLGLEIAGRAKNGEELLSLILSERPDIVITDIRMPGASGLEIIAKTLEAGLSTRFVIVSAYANFEYARKAIQLGAEDFLPKPVNRLELTKRLKLIINKLKTSDPQTESCRKLIRTAKEYIDLNYEKHLTLEMVAAEVYVSASYLSTLFKKETGVNFNQYLTDVRMKNAESLLKNRNYSVAQVAEMVGYRDVKHFSSVFQKYYHTSPAQYRK